MTLSPPQSRGLLSQSLSRVATIYRSESYNGSLSEDAHCYKHALDSAEFFPFC